MTKRSSKTRTIRRRSSRSKRGYRGTATYRAAPVAPVAPVYPFLFPDPRQSDAAAGVGNTEYEAGEARAVDAIAARARFTNWAARNPEQVHMAKAISSRLRYLQDEGNPLSAEFLHEVLTRIAGNDAGGNAYPAAP